MSKYKKDSVDWWISLILRLGDACLIHFLVVAFWRIISEPGLNRNELYAGFNTLWLSSCFYMSAGLIWICTKDSQ